MERQQHLRMVCEGIQSEKENLQDLPLELFQPYFEAMMRENLLVINDLADLAQKLNAAPNPGSAVH